MALQGKFYDTNWGHFSHCGEWGRISLQGRQPLTTNAKLTLSGATHQLCQLSQSGGATSCWGCGETQATAGCARSRLEARYAHRPVQQRCDAPQTNYRLFLPPEPAICGPTNRRDPRAEVCNIKLAANPRHQLLPDSLRLMAFRAK